MTDPASTPPASTRTDKGVRGFELDIHVAFTQPLPAAQARAALLTLDGFTVDLYRPHPAALHADQSGGVGDVREHAQAQFFRLLRAGAGDQGEGQEGEEGTLHILTGYQTS